MVTQSIYVVESWIAGKQGEVYKCLCTGCFCNARTQETQSEWIMRFVNILQCKSLRKLSFV